MRSLRQKQGFLDQFLGVIFLIIFWTSSGTILGTNFGILTPKVCYENFRGLPRWRRLGEDRWMTSLHHAIFEPSQQQKMLFYYSWRESLLSNWDWDCNSHIYVLLVLEWVKKLLDINMTIGWLQSFQIELPYFLI